MSRSPRLTTFRTWHYRLPPSIPWSDAALTVDALDYIILELYFDTACTGLGIAYTVGPGSEALLVLVEICANHLLGRSLSEHACVHAELRHWLHRCGHGGLAYLARAAVDIAFWDARAKMADQPLATMLGAVRHSIPAYASGIDLHLSPLELGDVVHEQINLGASSYKMKVGCATLREDFERAAAAREALGPDGRLFLDANQGWNLAEAKFRLKGLEEFAPAWIEEPLHPEDVDGHVELRRATSIPIALGESVYSQQQFVRLLKAGAADVYQPDVARVGGVTDWLRIAHLCSAFGMPVAPHYLAELSIHCLCSVDNALVLEDVLGGSLRDLGLTSAPLPGGFDRSFGEQPGHGIVIDHRNLSALKTSYSEVRP